MIRLRKGESYFFSRVVQVARDVAELEMNCTMVAETGPTIALRSNWSFMSQRIWSELGEGDAAFGRVIIVGGHGSELLTKPSKKYLNRRDVN